MAESTKAGANWSLPVAAAALAAGVVLGAGAMYLFGSGNSDPNGGPPPSTSPHNTSALGRIQPKGGLLTLTIPLPDQVVEIGDKVKEGGKIEEGDVIVKLSGNAEHKLKLELAEAQLENAKEQQDLIEESADLAIEANELQVKQLKKSDPKELSDAEKLQLGKIDVIREKLKTVTSNLEKLEGLTLVSNQERDEKKLLQYELGKQLAAAELELKQIEKGYELKLKAAMAKLAASKLEKQQALQKIKTLELNRDLAKSMYERTIVRALTSGKIVAMFTQVGELVGGMQPILTMADTDTMTVIAEVYETERDKVSLGQQVNVTGRAIKGKLTGKVVHISDRVGPNQVTPTNPLEKVDRRVVEVKIILDDNEQAAQLINHQVTATFLSKKQ